MVPQNIVNHITGLDEYRCIIIAKEQGCIPQNTVTKAKIKL